MTKEELIQWLEKYVEVARKERSILLAQKDTAKEIAAAEDTLKRTKVIIPKLKPLIKAILIGTFALAIFSLWVALFLAKAADSFWNLYAATMVVICFYWIIVLRKPAKKQLEKEKQEAREKLPKLQEQLKKIDDKMVDILMDVSIYEQQGVLPAAYMNYQASSKFLEYLRNERADTLKEAINLYETELYRERMYRENKRHNKVMEEEQARQTAEIERTRREAERAADTAEWAAEQSHRDSQFNLIAGAVIADAAIKEERQRNETPGMHV